MNTRATQKCDVTVVVPCFNAASTVSRTINSILAQEGVSVEIIVVDDGSTDESVEVVSQFGEQVRFVKQKNQGACSARNNGLAYANSDMIMFLDADDYIEGNFLSSAVAGLREANANLAFGNLIVEQENERVHHDIYEMKTSSDCMRGLIEKGFIPPCATVWSLDYIRRLGGWRTGLRRYQDYEVVFRALDDGAVVCQFHGGAGIYFQHQHENRISLDAKLETVLDQAEVLKYIVSCLKRSDLPSIETKRLIHKRTYKFWQMCCRNKNPEAARVARALYREVGGKRHIGSPTHKVISSIIGLRRKERISIWLHNLKKRYKHGFAF